MKLLYLDCGSGISGDMMAAALLDLLGEESWPDLERIVERIGLHGATVAVRRIRKGGFAAVDFETTPETGHSPHRTLADIERLLGDAGLEVPVLETSREVFRALARAEAEAHGAEESTIHFHEVGAVDSILDIVTASWAVHRLAADRILCSPLPMGRGTVRCAHGLLPVPAPATVLLTRGVPVYGGDVEGEMVTPTGAALAVTLSDGFGPLPSCVVRRTGVGAGKADRPRLNVLRAHLADLEVGCDASGGATSVVQIETSIDDMNPEAYTPLVDRLLGAGALDVHLVPVQMKKGRPGIVVSVLARPEDRSALTQLLLLHSSTFGVRVAEMSRTCLERQTVEVETPYGVVHVKKGFLDGRVVKAVPEYEDCRARAEERGIPFLVVYEAAVAAALAVRS